ncbi:hypothetical protein COOONC_21878 [Cooperia oncophora]
MHYSLNQAVVHLVDSHKIISPRIAVLRLLTKDQGAISIINGYAPTSTATDEEREEFYQLLEDTIQNERTYYKLCGWYLQSIIGHPNTTAIATPARMERQNPASKRRTEKALPSELPDLHVAFIMKLYFRRRPMTPIWTCEKGTAGDTISPKLTAALQYAMSNLNWDDKGYLIDGKRISNLRFADDIVLISDNTVEMEEMVNELDMIGQKIGLEMNMSKTKMMVNHWCDAGTVKSGRDVLALKEWIPTCIWEES